jgi:hypothetical protein
MDLQGNLIGYASLAIGQRCRRDSERIDLPSCYSGAIQQTSERKYGKSKRETGWQAKHRPAIIYEKQAAALASR